MTGILTQRVSDGKSPLAADEISDTAEAVGYGGVKYFDLRQNRINDYVFSFERMLSTDGDTNVYMQYQHARIASVGRNVTSKCNKTMDEIKEAYSVTVKEVAEINLVSEILRLPEVLEESMEQLQPHLLCQYMFTLCQNFSSFWKSCRVINEDEIDFSRVLLCQATCEAMRTAMRLLGLTPVNKL